MHATSQKEEIKKEAELLWWENFFFLFSLVIMVVRPQNSEYWVHL